MGFAWATDPGAEVVEPSSGRKALGYVGGVGGDKPPAGEFNWLFQQVAAVSQMYAMVFEAEGSLAACIGADMAAIPILVDTTITTIRLTCPASSASGTITIELFKVTPGGSPTTLYSSNPLPTLTCNGGYASVSSANLPNTVNLTAGDLLICRITDAPIDAYGLLVQAG